MARIIQAKRPSSVPEPKLLEYLRLLGSSLKEAEGLPNGLPGGTGLTHATVRAVHLNHVHELGAMLIRVAGGEDARKVFAQKGRRQKPADTIRTNRVASLAYFSARARDPKAKDDPAIKAARLFLRKGTTKRIRKTAQTHRAWCLEILGKHKGYTFVGTRGAGPHPISGMAQQVDPVVRADGGCLFIRCWGAKKVEVLSEYLRWKGVSHVED